MAVDIFGNETNVGGAWKIDGAVLSVAGAEDIIVIGCSIRYTRALTDYAPLNQNKRYMIAGPGSGVISLDSLIGPTGAVKTFIDLYADVCNVVGDKNAISIKPTGIKACVETDQKPVEFVASNNVLTDVNLSINNTNGLTVVTSGMTIRTLNLQIKYL